MKYFVLFSMILIVASVIILMMPPLELETEREGFTPHRTDDDDDMYQNLQQPAPAGCSNASSTAGAADGTSDHQHLLDGLLAKHDRLFEAFETKVNHIKGVSATTTQKNGIASTTEKII